MNISYQELNDYLYPVSKKCNLAKDKMKHVIVLLIFAVYERCVIADKKIMGINFCDLNLDAYKTSNGFHLESIF